VDFRGDSGLKYECHTPVDSSIEYNLYVASKSSLTRNTNGASNKPFKSISRPLEEGSLYKLAKKWGFDLSLIPTFRR
jgi:hypothetical protein